MVPMALDDKLARLPDRPGVYIYKDAKSQVIYGNSNWYPDDIQGVAPPGSISEELLATLVDAFATVIALASGDPGSPQDSDAALNSLTFTPALE